MSKQALYHYAESLPLVQRATFTDSTGTVRTLGENGRDLLVWLCDATNEKRGYTFHHSHRYISENTDVHVQTVKRLLAGFEQLGWITRTGEEIRYKGRGAPTVEYVLTFYPEAWSEYEKWRTGSQTSSHRATNNPGKANNGNALPEKVDTETEPQTEPQPQPKAHSPKQAGAGGGGELSKEGTELLAKVLETEDLSRADNPIGLRKYLEGQYLPIVQAWEKERPNADPVTWCREQRGYVSNPVSRNQRTTYLPEVPQGSQDCSHGCEGQGFHQFYDSEVMHQVTRKCVCAGGTYSLIDTHQATTERVSADKASNTYIPAPGAQADPQSDPVQELTERLRAV